MVTSIGIDDFALKKRHRYGTVFVNHDTYRIISMIPSRDSGDVANELKKFHHLKKVSRDGSVTYKNAINMVDENIIQISDRFHILKSLSEGVSQEMRNILPLNITIDKIDNIINVKSLKERFYHAKHDVNNGISLKKACINNQINYRTMKKLMDMNELEIVSYFKDKEYTKRIERLEVKNKLVNEVKEMSKKGLSYRKISLLLNIDRRTVKKYADDEFQFTIENTSRHTINSCEKYYDQIEKMINEQYTVKEIYKQIVNQGYTGKYDLVRRAVSQIKKSGCFQYKVVVSRKYIIKLLYKPLNEIKEISKEKLRKVYQLYPKVKMLLELYHEFKSILLNIKSIHALNCWIVKGQKVKCSCIDSFINGLINDYEGIKNSIIHNESNGIVEASVNKLKLIKRIMYGRCSFELLKAKTLRMDANRS